LSASVTTQQPPSLGSSTWKATASSEERQQPSSLGSSSLKASFLQQQPSSLQVLSSKNIFKTSSLQPSSRFVSKTTISLGKGEVAPSPPILYASNNSVTCGVRPSPGGVRVAIGSSSDGIGGGVAGGEVGGGSSVGPRLGPRPWASCKGEVSLVEKSAAGVSTIKISPPSPASSTTTAARVNIRSFGFSSPDKSSPGNNIESSANKEDLPLLSLPSLPSETNAEVLGFSF